MKTRDWLLLIAGAVVLSTVLLVLILPKLDAPAEPTTLRLSESDLLPPTAAPTDAATNASPIPETRPPQPTESDEPRYPDLPRIGMVTMALEDADPSIAAALQDGGLNLRCEAELPDTPESLSEYRYTILPLDADALFQLVLGEDYTLDLEPDAVGEHGTLTPVSGAGTYYMNTTPGIGCFLQHKSGAVCRSGDSLASLPAELADLLGIEITPRRTGYACFNGLPCVEYAQLLDGVPVSSNSYYVGNDEGTGHGAVFQIFYDNISLKKLQLEYLVKAEPTGETYRGLLSAADALEIVRNRMDGASVNAVQIITECRLVWLPAIEQGDPLIPAWELCYDMYNLDHSGRWVYANYNEYVYRVDALDGTMYGFH